MEQQIIALISKARLTLNNEKKLQAELKQLLTDHFKSVEDEKRLDQKNIIDFFISGIGIEVKVKGTRKEIYKQCVRYCQFPEIKSIILITGVTTGFPEEINGKSCYILNLSRAWL